MEVSQRILSTASVRHEIGENLFFLPIQLFGFFLKVKNSVEPSEVYLISYISCKTDLSFIYLSLSYFLLIQIENS